MWAVKGLERDTAEAAEVPSPLAVNQMPASLTVNAGWGTLNPIVEISDSSKVAAFRCLLDPSRQPD